MTNKEITGQSIETLFPTEPIDRLMAPIQRFLRVETTSGIFLIFATLCALVWANFSSDTYTDFWSFPIGFSLGDWEMVHPLHWWVNDALMTLFFFMVGLEVKGEIVHGELRDIKAASLPIIAALGGMLFPAAVYMLLCPEGADRGWGIPMATDIAFVVGCMTLFGNRIPRGLHVLILTLAIADDIGSIVVVALGYSGEINWFGLLVAIALLALTWLSFRAGLRSLVFHGVLAVVIWYAFVMSGVHAALAGVALGFLTPVKPWLCQGKLDVVTVKIGNFLSGGPKLKSEEKYDLCRTLLKTSKESISLQERFVHKMHPWVSYLIMPLFALANAGVLVEWESFSGVTVSIAAGLIIGKPIGIFVFSVIAIKVGISKLPTGVSWRLLLGGGMLAGIGFTMSLFVSELAFGGLSTTLASAKIGILSGSLISAILGMVFIYFFTRKKESALENESTVAEIGK